MQGEQITAGFSALYKKKVTVEVKYHIIYHHTTVYSATGMFEFFCASRAATMPIFIARAGRKRMQLLCKPAAFSEANEMVDRYVDFYNRERIRLKTGETPLTRRLST